MRKTLLLAISLIVPLCSYALDFDIKIVKQYEKAVYIWVHVHNHQRGDDSKALIGKETLKLTTKYTALKKDVYILYMNDLKGIPPSVDSQKHAESIVLRSLSTTVMKLYFIAYCQASGPTDYYYYNPVEYLEQFKYQENNENK